MDDGRFDALTRVLGSFADRRVTLRAAAGGGLGGVLAALGLDAEAKKKTKTCKKGTKKCGKKCCAAGLFCNEGRCSATPCNAGNSACANNGNIFGCDRTGGLCTCVPLMQGGFALALFAPASECPVTSECLTNAECEAGEVCFKANRLAITEECCPGDEPLSICVPVCDCNPEP